MFAIHILISDQTPEAYMYGRWQLVNTIACNDYFMWGAHEVGPGDYREYRRTDDTSAECQFAAHYQVDRIRSGMYAGWVGPVLESGS